MKIFLIVLAVIVIIIALILSVSATFTIIYDYKWKTTIKVLWIEKDIKLTKILSFVLFPEESAKKVKAKQAEKKAEKSAEIQKPEVVEPEITKSAEAKSTGEEKNPEPGAKEPAKAAPKPKKPNYFKKLWDDEGIVGIMTFASNMLQTASSALGTLFRDFHIHSLYVKMIIGGSDAAEIAKSYGVVCKYYYPLKGIILNGMKVDNYDDMIAPDFIAPVNEYGLQFIGSISVGVLLKVVLAAGKTFLVNLIKNK